MEIKKLSLGLLLILLVIPMSWASTVSVSSVTGSVGDTVTVDININPQSVAEKSGNVVLTYDPTELQYVGVTNNNYFDSGMPVTVSNGKITITQYTVGAAKSIAGLWAKVNFVIIDDATLAFDQANTMWGLNAFTSFTGSSVTVEQQQVNCLTVANACIGEGRSQCASTTQRKVCETDANGCLVWKTYPCVDGTCNPINGLCECVPSTCADRGKNCGTYVEPECGTTLDCGDCSLGGQQCIGNVCTTVTSGPVCPNNNCESTETCFSCPADCGTCPTTPTTLGDKLDAELGADSTNQDLNPTLLTTIVRVLMNWFNI